MEINVSTDAFPSVTRLNVLYSFGEVIDVPPLVTANGHPRYNQTLCQVNRSVVRLRVVQGEYHWHRHDAEHEFFYVVRLAHAPACALENRPSVS